MEQETIWSVLEECFEPLNTDAYAVWQKIAKEQSFASGWMIWVAATFIFNDEPFSVEEFMRIFPYGSADVNTNRFKSAIRQGFLVSSTENKFNATEKGLYWVDQMVQAAEAPLESLQPIAPDDFQRMLGYTRHLVLASLSTSEPLMRFGAGHYYQNMHPGERASPIRLFVHYFGTLEKFRGNAHRLTWEHFGIEGNLWEVFSEIWIGKNNTLDRIFEELSFRGITSDEYAHLLRELTELGWIEESEGAYQLTAEGERIREEAEALTNQYFFAPWSCLNETELAELANLASQLRDGLKDQKIIPRQENKK